MYILEFLAASIFGDLVSSFVAILGYILFKKAQQIQHGDPTSELKSTSYMWNTIQFFYQEAARKLRHLTNTSENSSVLLREWRWHFFSAHIAL